MASTSLSSVTAGLEYSPLPHIVVNESTVVGANQACLKIFGEIIGQSLSEVVIDCPDGQFIDVLVRVRHCTGRAFQMLATSHFVDHFIRVIGLTSPKSSGQDVSLLRHTFAEPIARLSQDEGVRPQLSGDFTRCLEKLTFFHRLNGVDEFQLAYERVAVAAQLQDLVLKRTDVQLQIGKKIPEIVSNREAILFIVDELLENAITHNPPGCVKVTLDKEGRKGIVITVEDKGQGISHDADLQEGIRRSSSGGIGLAVCKALARRLEGELIIDSKSGEGTRAMLMLPSAPSQGKIGQIDSPCRKEANKFFYTVLVVDDNEVCGKLLLNLLKNEGFRGSGSPLVRKLSARYRARNSKLFLQTL